ncbi:MAG: YceI family protein, partial [Longimicrobiales bacterium]
GGHMHTKGKSLRVVLNPDRDDEQTLLHIPEWDFNWQGRYQYVTPIPIEVGDVVRIECRWDNARPGSTPRYHVWGEGTEDEMCLGALTVLPAEPGL